METLALTPMLRTGVRLTQAEFHRLYESAPKEFRAELIGGVVHVSSPLRWRHGIYHFRVNTLLGRYEEQTPGVEGGDNVTAILDAGNEVQPDVFLRILPEYGGQSRTNDQDYLVVAPELFTEVALSSINVDLGAKKEAYAAAGVLEYVVVALRQRQLYWFNLKTGRRLRPDSEGIFRSRVFPGLWIDGAALLARRVSRLNEVLALGLASPEHARFVKRLESRFRKGGA